MTESPGSSSKRTSTGASLWEKTKDYSSTAYTKALKPGFNKAYAVVDKLGAPVNRLSNKVGSEAFWPTTLDKESEKAARILRGFCKDGFYEQIDEKQAEKIENHAATVDGIPQGKQRVLQKIPAKVIRECVGLCIYTTMRTGWLLGGSGGAGVLVARHPETGEWSPPSGIQTQNLSFGFLAGVDIYDTVLVINNYKALEAFTKLRCTLGTEVGVAAGPVGMGGILDTEIHKRQAPIWSYVKSRGLYAGVALEGNLIIERTDENERFYGERVPASDILVGKLRHPPAEKYQILLDTLKAAQGDAIDDSLLPQGQAPSDMELITEETRIFGIPAEDDPDPYGVKALEAEGLTIREAGTHQRPSAEVFEFRPSPTSPIYAHFSRKSIDGSVRSRTWRDSTHSLASVDRATQTDEDDSKSAEQSPKRASVQVTDAPQSPKRDSLQVTDAPVKHSQNVDDETEHEEDHEPDHEDSFSDVESDAEIQTAVPVMARARVVEVPKRAPPALPPRHPSRVVSPTPTSESRPPVDGFDKISLNGSVEGKHDGDGARSPSPTRDTAESTFHSLPVTPSEEHKQI
ncbi:hypothetical protein HRR83_006408 [Exophiala dermatitidis]|uniref:Ysc84 actin-binding domain-containing protein n=2 Tax=Exophiala dermatitidis TaxID=5970 RepID=H6CA86_EXODN|nr:uncharacterized protein HMPREF1120_08022 [Exophiala dermatitidis NIH/UT8656]KAJ4507417.1 hypothetical protein HRR75_006766 [Exophiala dermatitidis]EHY60050.1 hypothetical protein HMPREF1120_08022 [Exophiala dermatitidis NIH/UT8656]KAJ4509412.1 hypothetical protein HRR73_007266 [Exophiala dermatitidis]KAJ4509599.1 hypothetical protein HRR74_007380 [Exophiala dermatitidis]KAJ4530606.1 hypothetical protein HRR76_008307 [Exophiala dermatitidis]